ncbi:MGDG synthase family glycosyltransferase [Alteribacter populi]|uniref:MGDG synthase family glycosyltransferase n=1 Tax=Alteribacter populi TaxID=2011011 RepID=UPI000BBA4E95|nr:hypothetical protein [Alteribacter populi]
MKARVLLLTASFGGKNHTVNEVLKEEWEGKGSVCESVDLISCLPSWFKLYLHIVEKVSRLSHLIFHQSNKRGYRFPSVALDSSFFWSRAIERIQLSRPSIIISVHPLATAVASLAIRCDAFKTKPSLFSLVTDYSSYGMSLTKETTAVFLPDKNEVIEQQKAFPFTKFVQGCVPIEKKWYNRADKDKLRERLGLPSNMRIATLRGELPYKKMIHYFKRCEEPWMLLCFPRENKREQKVLSKVKSRHDVRVFSNTQSISGYVKASDVLISKPESTAMAEANVAQVPTIMTKPSPGVEEANVRRLIHYPLFSSVTDLKMIGKRAEEVVQKQTSFDQADRFPMVKTEEMIENMIRLREVDRKKVVTPGEKGHLYRFHHELMMRRKREEEREFHS